jgi:hypothetical protein
MDVPLRLPYSCIEADPGRIFMSVPMYVYHEELFIAEEGILGLMISRSSISMGEQCTPYSASLQGYVVVELKAVRGAAA